MQPPLGWLSCECGGTAANLRHSLRTGRLITFEEEAWRSSIASAVTARSRMRARSRSGLFETLDKGPTPRCRRLAHRTIWLTRQL